MLTLFRLGGGGARGGRFTPPKTFKNPLLLTSLIASTVFLPRDFSSNLPGKPLVLSRFGN